MAVTARAQAAADRRRQILDAAVRVFARQGFHGCRVSDTDGLSADYPCR